MIDRIDSGVGQGCITSPYGCSIKRGENGDGENESEVSGGVVKMEIM